MSNIGLGVIIMAVVTYLIRVLPLIIINKEIESKFFKSFLYYVPYTVLAAMTFPAIIYSTGNMITGMLGGVIGIVLAYRGKSLLQTSLMTVMVVYLLNII